MDKQSCLALQGKEGGEGDDGGKESRPQAGSLWAGTTYSEKDLTEAVVRAAFSQFVQPATHDSGEASRA